MTIKGFSLTLVISIIFICLIFLIMTFFKRNQPRTEAEKKAIRMSLDPAARQELDKALEQGQQMKEQALIKARKKVLFKQITEKKNKGMTREQVMDFYDRYSNKHIFEDYLQDIIDSVYNYKKNN